MKKEKLDVNFSVFNQHINKAGIRALKVMKENFPTHFKEIQEKSKKGIMAIFREEPTEASFIYASLVTAFVNKY